MPHISALTFPAMTQPNKHGQHRHGIFPAQASVVDSLATNPVVNAELVAVIIATLGVGGAIPATGSSTPLQQGEYFSTTITNAMGDLPITVIKELKGGFKNYILLPLCMHKACSNATRATDLLDMEIGLNDKGEIKLKQKMLTVVKDHYLTTDDFTEIWENFCLRDVQASGLG